MMIKVPIHASNSGEMSIDKDGVIVEVDLEDAMRAVGAALSTRGEHFVVAPPGRQVVIVDPAKPGVVYVADGAMRQWTDTATVESMEHFGTTLQRDVAIARLKGIIALLARSAPTAPTETAGLGR